ncbi:ABC transporter permease [Limnoglobus roseus]|uniref:ABC transporter permease n=1 Tax=Limnoglobus roseus TaxID=2598579 RepID=A0A5C1A7I7_9BACT|nr:ABC transporter permease [Limnoglobus roseus]QEL14435.1 ABC transporter permease [Limnoglobus roseus]
MSLFGILILDREPLAFQHLPGLIQVWLQDAGGFAAVGLLIYLAHALFSPSDQPESTKLRMPVTSWMLLMAVVSLICYAAFAAMFIGGIGKELVEVRSQAIAAEATAYVPPKLSLRAQPVTLALGGLFALLSIGHPFARDLFKLRFRRTFAIAKLSVKEAIRDRLFLVFVIFLMIFLFPVKWFLPNNKPEDEIRLTLDVTAFASTIFLLVPAVIVAAFRIPNDIKHQTIYTIVTKPVERFEIVLGRFVGYSILISIALGLMTLVGWVYLTFGTTFDPKAVEESQRSRVPLRGKIDFRARTADYSGTNVGREFEYRKYIAGSKTTTERALWMFDSIPANLGSTDRDQVPCEFTFDIFKLTKGEENRGVDVNIRVTTWQCGQRPPDNRGEPWAWTDATRQKEYDKERNDLDEKLRKREIGGPDAPPSLAFARPGPNEAWKLVDQLAEKYGFFEISSTEVYDFHPATVYLPPGLFRNARTGTPPAGEPRVTVYVKCLSPGQMLGMAQGDLYLMEGEKTFTENYFKNAVGLWCRAVILVGISVTLSTYLSGVISLLASLFLYISAYFAEHLRDVATGQSVGGGPLESFKRLLNADTPTTPIDEGATKRSIDIADRTFAWVFRRYENIVPNIDAFTWTNYLKEGFNINAEYLVLNLLILIGYLLPWALLSYYLIRNREVAA